MAITGITRNSKKQQRINAELELIIEEFGRAMWNADKKYIARPPQCGHDDALHFTLSMQLAWNKYVAFCIGQQDEKA